jgi:hypothetical protein
LEVDVPVVDVVSLYLANFELVSAFGYMLLFILVFLGKHMHHMGNTPKSAYQPSI